MLKWIFLKQGVLSFKDKNEFKVPITERAQFEVQFMILKNSGRSHKETNYSRSILENKLSLICLAKLSFMHTAEGNCGSARTLSQHSIKSLS